MDPDEGWVGTLNNFVLRACFPPEVLSFCTATGCYNLECKQMVPPHKIRWPVVSSASLPYVVGETVEYESASAQGQWVLTEVLGISGGLYDLSCKQMVPPQRIRRLDPFPVGATVEFGSVVSQGDLCWMAGHVVAYDAPTGLCDLDVMMGVPRSRVRWPGKALPC